MKRLSLILILFLVSFSSSFAQDKASDLKKLFGLMKSEEMVDKMTQNLIPLFRKQAEENIKGEDEKEKFNVFMDFMMGELKSMTMKMVNEDMVVIYDKHFTHQEIKDLIRFYESPTGKKMIEKTPVVMKEFMEAMMSKHLPEFKKKMAEKAAELKG